MSRPLALLLTLLVGTASAQQPAANNSSYHEVHQAGKLVTRAKSYEEAQQVAEKWEKLNKEKGTCLIKGPFTNDTKANSSSGSGTTTTPWPEHLNPDKLKSIDARIRAYYAWVDLLQKAGGKAAEIRFPIAAGDVSSQFVGELPLIVNTIVFWTVAGQVVRHVGKEVQSFFYFEDSTMAFLEKGNDQLYRFNSSVFDKLRRNPNVMIDPLRELSSGLVTVEELKNPPKTPFEFDIRMVQAEQRKVGDILKRLDPSERAKIVQDINKTFDTRWHEDLLIGVIYGDQMRWAIEAKKAKIDFNNEEHRRAVGYAMIFKKHGLSKEQYLDFMKTGKLPKKA